MPEAEEVLENISKFVTWLASRSARAVPLMDFDEMVGELNLEVVKGIRYYDGKPMNELLALLRRMCDNRVGELKYRYTLTHRKAAITTLPISVLEGDHDSDNGDGYKWAIDNAVKPDDEIDSATRVSETRRRLSPASRKVFDAVIYGHPNMATQIKLSGTRASHAYKTGGTIKVKPHHVAEALAIDEDIAKASFKEIRRVYAAVRREYG